MKHSQDNLAQTMLDVRRAYRLVAAYQRRALDIIHYLASQFEGMSFYYWSPQPFHQMPRRASKPVPDLWCWDGLPLYSFSVAYLPENTAHNQMKPGGWMLEIHIEADNGFDFGNREPDPARLEPAELCESQLYLCAWRCHRETTVGNWWTTVWEAFDWPEEDKEVVPLGDGAFSVVGLTAQLETIDSQESLNGIADEFKALIGLK